MGQQTLKSRQSDLPLAEEHVSRQLVFACPSCATETLGQFCSHCGEKEIGKEDYSLRHFLAESVSALTLLESRVLRSVWLVISRPRATPSSGARQ